MSDAVRITNPKATRLPRQRGEFLGSPAPAEPIRPKTITERQQIREGPSVTITNKRKANE